MLKDVFVRACGRGVFPGVGFMVMGCGCLCRRLVMARGGLALELPLAEGRRCRRPDRAVAAIYSVH